MEQRGAILAILLALGGAWMNPAEAARPATLEECDALVRDHPGELSSYRCFWFVARNQAVWPAAAARLEALLQQDPGNYRTRLILGALAADSREARALDLFRQAAADAARANDAECEVHARVSLGVALRHRGKKAEAGRELDAALECARRAGRADLLTEVRIQAGWQEFHEGNYGAAYDRLTAAEAEVFAGDNVFLKLETLDGLAAVAWARGQFGLALELYGRQLALMAGRDPFRESSIRRNQLTVALELVAALEWDKNRLLELAGQTIEQARRSGNALAEGAGHLALGEHLPAEQALPEIEAGLALARRSGSVNTQCWGLFSKAKTLAAARPRNMGEALAAVDEGIELARRGSDPENLAAGLAIRARLRWNPEGAGEALPEALAALDAVEKIRDLQPDRETRARVFGRFAGMYRDLIGRMLEAEAPLPSLPRTALAFATAERMRARVLLETLDAAGIGSSPAVSFPETTEEAARAALRGLQEALGPDQALLSFVMPGSLPESQDGWVFVVTSGNARAVPLGRSRDLEREIPMYRALLERRDDSEAAGAARLHRRLLAPALESLPPAITRLVWIPDGVLHELPLDTLRAAPDAPPLAAAFEISRAPSAESWKRWKQHPATQGAEPLLSLADPEGTALAADSWRQAGGPIFGGPLGRLPFARREAEALRKLFGPGSTSLAGVDASERAVKEKNLERLRVLHLAVHAIVDDEHPDRSAVLLNPAPEGEDGRLQFGEIARLRLSGPAVLLSACRGASGPLIGGEGALGIAHAFFQAGAQAVVAGLWPVRDEETSDLVIRFGRHLARGKSVAASLTAARREMISKGSPPAAWAGLIVLGNGDLVPFPGGRPTPFPTVWVAGVGLLSLLGAGAWCLGRRRAR